MRNSSALTFLTAVPGCHGSALAGEAPADRSADATRPTRDQGYPSGQLFACHDLGVVFGLVSSSFTFCLHRPEQAQNGLAVLAVMTCKSRPTFAGTGTLETLTY